MTGAEVLPHTPSFSLPMLSVFPRSLHGPVHLEHHLPSSPSFFPPRPSFSHPLATSAGKPGGQGPSLAHPCVGSAHNRSAPSAGLPGSRRERRGTEGWRGEEKRRCGRSVGAEKTAGGSARAGGGRPGPGPRAQSEPAPPPSVTEPA